MASVLGQENAYSLKGEGADFGCGYGYISAQILRQSHYDIKKLSLIDHDIRALNAAAKNVGQAQGVTIDLLWRDITAMDDLKGQLDFVVMNPPFHEGKKGIPDLGLKFIERACESLHKKGALYMVANCHLPYEATLQQCFAKVEEIARRDGFKIIRGTK